MKKIDSKIKEAIEAAVRGEAQSEALSRQLVAWFEALAVGNEEANDDQSEQRRLDSLYRETSVVGGGKENSSDHTPESSAGERR